MPSRNTHCLTWVSLTLGVGYLFTAQVVTTGALSAGSRNRCAAERSYLTSEVRGSSQEEQPQVQGAVAVLVQEGLEELLHVQGQEG